MRATASKVMGFGLLSLPVSLCRATRRRRGRGPAADCSATDRLDVVAFAPLSGLDPTLVRASHHLRPGAGGDRAFVLFAEAMARTERMAVCHLAWRGRLELVVVRPRGAGLVLHQLLDEETEAPAVPDATAAGLRNVERDLADKLIAQLAVDRFDPRALAPCDEADRGDNVIDLLGWLRRSIDPRVANNQKRAAR